MSSKESLLGVRSRWESSNIFSFKIKTLLMLVCATVFLFVLLFSFSAGYTQAVGETTGEFTENVDHSILSNHDMDGDGIDDATELLLETEEDNYYGDKDKDGLYDFEEYLDLYGTPDDDTDTNKYDFNNSKTGGSVLDIYDYFGLTVNKTGFVRDDSDFTSQNGGFTDHLLWNVTFNETYAGGSSIGSVSYTNNILINVTFSGTGSGGSRIHAVSYTGNTLTNVNFSGTGSGGSRFGAVNYTGNTFDTVTFSRGGAGGAPFNKLSYTDNTFDTVTFSGYSAGGGALVVYTNNTFATVTFSGDASGGSPIGIVLYTNNTFATVTFSGDGSGGSYGSGANYTGNTFNDVTFDGWYAGGSQHGVVLYESNNFTNIRYNKSTTSDGVYGNSGLSGSGLTNYTNNIFDQVEYTQLDGRRVEFNVTSIGNTIVNDSYDSDDDELGDIFEFLTSGSDPENKDSDGDTLNDSYEVDIGLDASSSDTDADGLNDAWELMYNGSSGVNPLVPATEAELGSDIDMDGYNLSGEAARGTNPENVISVATPRETTSSSAATSSIERQGSLTSPLMPLVMLMVALSTGILISGWVRRRSKHRGNEYT